MFPKLAIEMISVGEETGSLENMLRDVAEFYENDLDLRLTQLTTWIEPALLLIMGVLVGAIVIARKRVVSPEMAERAGFGETLVAPMTPIDDNPHSIPVVGTENPRHKEYPET